jgi:hypothetical protein
MKRSKDLNLCESAKVFSFPYLKKHIIKNLMCIKGMIIDTYQRIRYGVSRQDAHDFDHYLMVVIENGLKYLKDEGHSYPGWCSYEDWHTKLDYMIKLAEIANRYEDEVTEKSFDKYLQYYDKYGKDSERTEKAKSDWLTDELESDTLKYNARVKLLQELKKYIHDLWD